jgi:fructose/tagatose bisphosphate aldolase
MLFKEIGEIRNYLTGAIGIRDGAFFLGNSALLQEKVRDVVYNAIFNDDDEIRNVCRWLVYESALSSEIFPASIHPYYMEMGKGKHVGHTVPAINLRGLTFDCARAVFRAARDLQVGAMIFEIARSEIGYTAQRPREYATSVLGAAIREGYRGPVFLQGDHFQVNQKKFDSDSDAETGAVASLISEAIEAGFYNIDIDTSTLVDLSRSTIKEQQELNYRWTAHFLKQIREEEPENITVSVGGEIGEVGKKNTTPDELLAYMEGLQEETGGDMAGISKISVQTGTTHGGVVLPDGSIAKVKIDFDTLKELSDIARKIFGMAGAVQHGASTLPDEAFDKFPQTGTAEIHLATGFQNIIFDHDLFPEELRNDIHTHLNREHIAEKKTDQTMEQFIYKTRKKAMGPFKQRMWDLPADILSPIMGDLEKKFRFLFEQLKAVHTVQGIEDAIHPEIRHQTPPQGFQM